MRKFVSIAIDRLNEKHFCEKCGFSPKIRGGGGGGNGQKPHFFTFFVTVTHKTTQNPKIHVLTRSFRKDTPHLTQLACLHIKLPYMVILYIQGGKKVRWNELVSHKYSLK